MNDPQIRQMRDFLQIFNNVGETCFQHCVNTFTDRQTSKEEISCLDKCVKKYLEVNHKVMEIYVEVQPEIVQKRIDEVTKMQEEMAARAAAEAASAETNTTANQDKITSEQLPSEVSAQA